MLNRVRDLENQQDRAKDEAQLDEPVRAPKAVIRINTQSRIVVTMRQRDLLAISLPALVPIRCRNHCMTPETTHNMTAKIGVLGRQSVAITMTTGTANSAGPTE